MSVVSLSAIVSLPTWLFSQDVLILLGLLQREVVGCREGLESVTLAAKGG